MRSREGLLRYCSNNLNQYAKRANETGSIYTEDIKDLQNRQNEIREITKEILARLATDPVKTVWQVCCHTGYISDILDMKSIAS